MTARGRIRTWGSLAGVAILIVVGSLSCGRSLPLPSDAELTTRFREHRSEFDSLAAMALADTQLVGLGTLGRFEVFVRDTSPYNRRLTDDEVRATGRSEFRRLIDRAGVPSLSRSAEGDRVWFVVVSNGGTRKGLMYSQRPMEPLLTSLDGRDSSGYVPLAPRWFLFVEPSD